MELYKVNCCECGSHIGNLAEADPRYSVCEDCCQVRMAMLESQDDSERDLLRESLAHAERDRDQAYEDLESAKRTLALLRESLAHARWCAQLRPPSY